MRVCLNRRLVSTPIPPNRPVNPLQSENFAVGFPLRRAGRHKLCKHLLKSEPGITNLVIQRVHRFAAKGDGFQPRRKG